MKVILLSICLQVFVGSSKSWDWSHLPSGGIDEQPWSAYDTYSDSDTDNGVDDQVQQKFFANVQAFCFGGAFEFDEIEELEEPEVEVDEGNSFLAELYDNPNYILPDEYSFWADPVNAEDLDWNNDDGPFDYYNSPLARCLEITQLRSGICQQGPANPLEDFCKSICTSDTNIEDNHLNQNGIVFQLNKDFYLSICTDVKEKYSLVDAYCPGDALTKLYVCGKLPDSLVINDPETEFDSSQCGCTLQTNDDNAMSIPLEQEDTSEDLVVNQDVTEENFYNFYDTMEEELATKETDSSNNSALKICFSGTAVLFASLLISHPLFY